MAVSFAREVAAGFMAAVMEEQEPIDRLKRAGQLGGTVVQEIAAGLALAPHLGRAVRVHRSLPVAGTTAAATGDGTPFGVVLHPSIPYGPGPRQLLDIYVPFDIYKRRCPTQQEKLRARQRAGGGVEGVGGGGGGGGAGDAGADAPVVFFVHGGIWATGDRFHFAPMAVRLAQAGLVVVVISYTLYPEAMADVMAAETLRALMWTLTHARRYGGDPSRLAVAGHSAGAHLGSLALVMLAQLRRQEAEEARQVGRGGGSRRRGGGAAAADGGGGGEDGGAPWHPGPALALARVQLFIGMSGVYHVARHHEYEASRGVHQLSTMGRACGGPELWGEVSPAAVLARAAAEAAAASAAAASPAGHAAAAAAAAAAAVASGADVGDQEGAAGARPSYYGAFALAGEAVPYRSGLDASPSGAVADAAAGAAATAAAGAAAPRRRPRHHTRHHFPRHAAAAGAGSAASSNPKRQHEFWEDEVLVIVEDGGQPLSRSGVGDGLVDSLELLAGFDAEAATQLPPFLLMSSLGDVMVQWHEAQEMAMRLLQLRVPVKHLVYGGTSVAHNDFAFNWRPLPFPHPAPAPAPAPAEARGGLFPAAAAGAGGSTGAGGGGLDAAGDALLFAGLPPFARDLLLVLLGRVRVRFLTGPPPALAVASKL